MKVKRAIINYKRELWEFCEDTSSGVGCTMRECYGSELCKRFCEKKNKDALCEKLEKLLDVGRKQFVRIGGSRDTQLAVAIQLEDGSSYIREAGSCTECAFDSEFSICRQLNDHPSLCKEGSLNMTWRKV